MTVSSCMDEREVTCTAFSGLGEIADQEHENNRKSVPNVQVLWIAV